MAFDAVELALRPMENCSEETHSKMSNRSGSTSTLQRGTPQPRRYPRYRYDARVLVSVFREGATTEYWGRSNEIGLDGVGATLTGELKIGEVVSLEFPIPLAPRMMRLRAIVRYSDGLRFGCEFLVVTEEQKDLIQRVCESLARTA